MKYLKELVQRFPLLIAAMILALLGVYKDYSSHSDYLHVNEVQVVENVRSNEGAIPANLPSEHGVDKNVSNKNLSSENARNSENSSGKNLSLKTLVGKKIAGSSIEIIKVIDGDSLRIRIDESSPITVRLYGIDAPEYKQKYGKEAQYFLHDLVNNNAIESLEIINIDRYDRPVVVMSLAHGLSVQEELLKNGMAWYYERFCKIEALCVNFKKLAKNAKNERLGLWADASPKAPWNWKKQK